MVLAHPEDDGDDVLGRVTQSPKVSHHLVCFVNAAVDAVLQHVFDQNWVWLIADLRSQPGSLALFTALEKWEGEKSVVYWCFGAFFYTMKLQSTMLHH